LSGFDSLIACTLWLPEHTTKQLSPKLLLLVPSAVDPKTNLSERQEDQQQQQQQAATMARIFAPYEVSATAGEAAAAAGSWKQQLQQFGEQM